MSWRKVLVRGLVFTVMGGFVLGAIVYRAWTNPRAVREQVIAKLSQICTGALVSVESAHLRLFGGVIFSDLRLARRDDLSNGDFLYVPAGVIYHDKQQILDGNFAVRKCELNRLRLRLIRERDGRWNIQGLFGTSETKTHIPTIVIQQGTIVVEDRSSPSTPLLEIHDVNVTILNDPLDVLLIEGTGIMDVAGPAEINARVYRDSGRANLFLKCPEVPVGPTLIQRLSVLAPELAVHLRNLRGDGRVSAQLTFDPQASPQLAFDTTVHLSDAEFTHALMPLPLQDVEASLRCKRGTVSAGFPSGANNQPDVLSIPACRVTARSGETLLKMELQALNFPLPLKDEDLVDWQNHVRHFECKAENLWLTPKVWDSMPEFLQKIRQNYNPGGLLNVTHTIDRTQPQSTFQEWLVEAQQMTGVWSVFPYPVTDIEGTLVHKTSTESEPSMEVHITGKAGTGTVKLDGTLRGLGATNVSLVLDSKNIPVDNTLYDAMQQSVRAIAKPYTVEGSIHVTANIEREDDGPFRNYYRVILNDGTVRYDEFPYRLERATAILDINPDHWILHELRGFHNEGEMVVQARSYPPQPQTSEIVRAANNMPASEVSPNPASPVWIRLYGKNILADKELERALTPVSAPEPSCLQATWKRMAPSGRMNFVADIVDRGTPTDNLDVTVQLTGPSIKPKFFTYKLDDVRARVRYYKDRVYLNNFSGTHGTATLTMPEGQVFLKREGGYQVRLAAVRGTSVTPDADFLRALPTSLRKGFESLDLKGPIDWTTALVIDPPSEGSEPVVWWDGSIYLNDATMKTGIDWTGVKGQLWTRGRYDGERLESVIGGINIERATVLDQPIKNLRCRLEVSPNAPESLRIRHVTAGFFDGAIGGEARIDFGPTFKYDLYLKALQVDLEKFGKQNGLGKEAELQGKAIGALHLMGEGTDVGNLRGNGRLDVPTGKLYRLPVLLDLLKAFGLRLPDRTAFEQAHLTFGIEGTQMLVQDLDLIGNAISLRGKGSLNLDGSDLNLVFNTDWARMAQLLPPGITEIPRSITDQLFQIKMQGRVGEVKFEKELIPSVTDPLKRIIGVD